MSSKFLIKASHLSSKVILSLKLKVDEISSLWVGFVFRLMGYVWGKSYGLVDYPIALIPNMMWLEWGMRETSK